jgi:hypothetical protein
MTLNPNLQMPQTPRAQPRPLPAWPPIYTYTTEHCGSYGCRKCWHCDLCHTTVNTLVPGGAGVILTGWDIVAVPSCPTCGKHGMMVWSLLSLLSLGRRMGQVEASKRQLMAELLVGVHRICGESGVAPGDLAYVMPRHDGGHQRRPRREGRACEIPHDSRQFRMRYSWTIGHRDVPVK